MNATYSPLLVVTSVLVAIAASYTALDLAGRITAARGRTRYAWLAGGSLAMGFGIWSMHFIAMLAYHLPVPMGYHVEEVVLSAAVAVAASLFALLIASGSKGRIVSFLAGGALMGPAIAGMHYIGMAAVRVPAPLSYSPPLVVLSVVIAITASCAALWLAFFFRKTRRGKLAWGKPASAVIMGFAIAGMHYTAMAAAHFGTMNPALLTDERVVATPGMALAVLLSSMVILGIALAGGFIDRRMQDQRQTVGRLASVLDATTDYAGTTDVHGRFLYLNQAGRRMLGIAPGEDVRFLTLADIYPPRMVDELNDEIIPGTIRDGVWKGETFFRHRDGREIPVSLVALAHRSVDGEVEFLSGIARDISEQVAIRQALEQARADADRAAAAKTSFLANMSHEIRTPLNGIMGMLELLLDTELTAEQHRHADLMSVSADALLAIVNDVLDLSKIEAGQLDLEDVAFDLHALVDSAVRLHAIRAAEQRIELLYDMPVDVPGWVRGDPGRLRQVLTNLIGNAVKFTHQGEVALHVAVREVAHGRGIIHFSVKDTGIGIPPEVLETLFRPFKQADASTTRKYGGTGLGLSIARRLVNLMGGDIQVTSHAGRGSEFSFELSLPVQQRTEPGPVVNGELRGARVLVVDDNATNRRLVREMLGAVGCEVTEASDAFAGIERLRQAARDGQPYRLLITDLLMPERDGFELASLVRQDPALAGVRVMLLTSAGRRGDGQRARELGVDAYLLKPISRVELLEATRATLSGGANATAGQLVTRYTIEESRHVRRILLAEDNPVNQQVAAGMLRKRGHHVDIVENGRLAVTAALSKPYHMILMDVQMPELDGLSATREIRAALGGKPLPIIAVTADALPEERQRCLDAGMDGYLAKPFKAHELFAIIEEWGRKASPVDLDGFRRSLRSGGVEEMVGTLLGSFLEDAPHRLAALVDAVENRDAAAIQASAHAYKASAGTIHAAGLLQLLETAEQAGRTGNLESAAEVLGRIREEHQAILTQLAAETSRTARDTI